MSEVLHSAKGYLSTAILYTWKTMITTFLQRREPNISSSTDPAPARWQCPDSRLEHGTDATLMANRAQQGL